LALIDSRNALLTALAHDESPAALHLAARAGHFQEYWLTCHLQRQRGQACDPAAPRLASIQPQLAAWLAGDGPAPAPETVRGYLAETLEPTLDLLAGTDESDAALHYFRASLLHEDRLAETLTVRSGLGSPVGRALRDPIALPAQRWCLGTPAGQAGLVPHNERGAQTVDVPACEIDAQAVTWAQYRATTAPSSGRLPAGPGCRSRTGARRAAWSRCAVACCCGVVPPARCSVRR
jgi:hypothetical protein